MAGTKCEKNGDLYISFSGSSDGLGDSGNENGGCNEGVKTVDHLDEEMIHL